MNPEGMVGLLDYREDGVTPFMVFFKDGLEIEKCVSTRLKLASHRSAGKKAQGGLCVLVCMCASVTAPHRPATFTTALWIGVCVDISGIDVLCTGIVFQNEQEKERGPGQGLTSVGTEGEPRV